MAARKRTKPPKNKKDPKSGRVTFVPGLPLAVEDSDEPIEVTNEARQTLNQVHAFLEAYIGAGHELLSGPYKDVRELAPAHFAAPSKVYAFCCTDGVVIRYERCEEGDDELRVGFSPEPAAEIAKGISENVIYCVPEGTKADEIDTSLSPTLEMYTAGVASDEKNIFASSKIAYICPLPENREKPKTPPGKPFRLIGVESQFEVQMLAEQRDIATPDAPGRMFLAKSSIRMPVGWEHIEVYPDVDDEYWDVEFASSWAESDILGRVIRQQMREQGLRALDPNVDARKEASRLLDEYQAILEAEPQEEVLQQFLTRNPGLLAPTHARVWPKIPFGDKVSDFVFKTPTATTCS